MQREATNRIRFLIEDCLPPVLRDSGAFRAASRLVFGGYVDSFADFRRRAAEVTPEEYEELYRLHPRVHDQTDNSRACIEQIVADVVGETVCDVGCGTGYLVNAIRRARGGALRRCTGVDFVEPTAAPGFDFVKAPIEQLPFDDHEFDTVVCTHVLEHILDYRDAIRELRRLARKRLIVVVPREREGLYSFNAHFNFFPYPHSFLRAMIPLPQSYLIKTIGRDIYYREDVQEGAKA